MFCYELQLKRERLRSLGITCSVSLADAAKTEVNAFCFTYSDPNTHQPEDLKKNSEIKTMLANVRPNYAYAAVMRTLQYRHCFVLSGSVFFY
jgi:hypothetical protein